MDISPMVIPHLLAGLTSLGLGTYVLSKNRKDITSRVFFGLMLTCGIWSLGEFTMQLTRVDVIGKMGGIGANIGFIFIPVALLHFAIIYTRGARKGKARKPKRSKKPSLLPVLYVPSIIIAILMLTMPSLFFTVELVEELRPDALIDGDGAGANWTTTGKLGRPSGSYRRLFPSSWDVNTTVGEDIRNWYFRDLDMDGSYGFNNSLPEPIMYLKPRILFNWTEIPGPHDDKLLTYLEVTLGVNWSGIPDISKHDKQPLIMVADDDGTVFVRLDEVTGSVLVTLKNDERYEHGSFDLDGNITIFETVKNVLFDTSYANYSGLNLEKDGARVMANATLLDSNITWVGFSSASNNASIFWIDSKKSGIIGRYDDGEKLMLENGNGYYDITTDKIYENFKYAPGPLYNVIISLFFLFIIGSLAYFFKEYLTPRNAAARKQIRFMLTGLLILIVFILMEFVMQAQGFILLVGIWDSLLTLLISLFFAVAVLKYNLMDVQVLLKKSLTYSIIVLIMAVIFTVIGESLEFLTGKMLPELSELVSNIVSALIVSILFMPVINLTKRFFNKMFPKLAKYEKEYVERISAYEATLEAMWQDRDLNEREEKALAILRNKLNITQQEHEEITKRRGVKSQV